MTHSTHVLGTVNVDHKCVEVSLNSIQDFSKSRSKGFIATLLHFMSSGQFVFRRPNGPCGVKLTVSDAYYEGKSEPKLMDFLRVLL